MGMSIDEAIGLLERGSQYNYYDSAEDFCKAYDMAIDTMRKYQKIQEVMDSRVDDDAKSNSKALSEIEVIMYGDFSTGQRLQFQCSKSQVTISERSC